MNFAPGFGAPSPRQLITRARFLVVSVDRSIQNVLARAPGATVFLPEAVIRNWRSALETARRLLSSIAAPLIFPPPPWLARVQAASAQIDNALQALAAISVPSPRMFPPRPGAARVQVQVLRQIQVNLRLAAQNLREAERLLAGPQR